MAIDLKKTLYVGVGGTGVATLLKVKKCFIDSYGEVPPMIGFLAIDTDSAATNKFVTSNKGEHISLSASELLVCTVRGALDTYRQNQEHYGWVPQNNVNALSNIQGGGAGQVRSNGRFIAYFNNVGIKNAINASINKISQLLPLNTPYSIINGEEVYINVVASVAGGTGSGMLIDILCIINAIKRQQGSTFKVYPWIVLPEVFRAMANGPSMANVLYNSYGALKELDYLMHYNSGSPAIDFGYTRIDDSLFDYAYIINNVNKKQTTFNALNDLTDVMAMSMYLPTSVMGNETASTFDNILVQKSAGTYDIHNKVAWAASVSSSELIYDAQAVGRAYAYRIISQLCTSMLQSPTDGIQDANKFVNDPNVKIMEHEADDVIDALLTPAPTYSLNIDEQTTQVDIDTYIDNNCSEVKLEEELKNNLECKFNAAKDAFENTYIPNIMSRTTGKVDAAIKFIQSLQGIISLCKQEMTEEGDKFHRTNSTPVQWNFYLNAITNKGLAGLFKKTNEDAVQDLQQKIIEVATSQREEIRRKWALAFYNKFETEVLNPKLQALQGLQSVIRTLEEENSQRLIGEQHMASSKSDFQVFLHTDNVRAVSSFNINDDIRNEYVTFLGDGGMATHIGDSKEAISNLLKTFAKERGVVKNAVNTSIDNVLNNLPEEQVKFYLGRLQDLAAPLWTYNTQGYLSSQAQLDSFVVVGVDDRNTSILCTDSRYKSFFSNTDHPQPAFASMGQSDRVYVLVVENLLPIYAINNFKSYEMDHQDKVRANVRMANYIDDKLNNRINAENFSVVPVMERNNILELWVMGFVFDLIHYDKENEMYWIRSTSRGDAFEDFRFNLSKSRDVAYNMFKSEHLYKEVEEIINERIKRTGKDSLEKRIDDIKSSGSYFKDVSQLSSLEMENIKDPKFKAVRDLVEQEIKLMTN